MFCLNANCHLFSPLRLLSFLLCFQLFPPPSLFLIHCFTPLFCCHCLLCTCGCLFLCTASSEEPSLQPLNCPCSPVHSLCPITPFASSPGLPSHFSYLFPTCLFFLINHCHLTRYQFDYLILPQKHFGQDFLPIFPSKGLNHLCGVSLPLFFFMTLSFTIPSSQK